MAGIIILDKKTIGICKFVGETPLQAIKRFQKNNPEYQDQKIAYAGRLDPMAEGLLLLLIGEETKQREKYQALDKVYEFEVLLGIKTDSYDILGLLKDTSVKSLLSGWSKKVDSFIKSKLGKQIQKYPPYSAKAVNGRKLFEWAKEGRLPEIEIPEREIEVYAFEKISETIISCSELKNYVIENVSKVEGVFRQEETLVRWEEFSRKNVNVKLIILRLRMACSSGSYMRSFANELGNYLGSGGITLTIKRIQVGNFLLDGDDPMVK